MPNPTVLDSKPPLLEARARVDFIRSLADQAPWASWGQRFGPAHSDHDALLSEYLDAVQSAARACGSDLLNAELAGYEFSRRFEDITFEGAAQNNLHGYLKNQIYFPRKARLKALAELFPKDVQACSIALTACNTRNASEASLASTQILKWTATRFDTAALQDSLDALEVFRSTLPPLCQSATCLIAGSLGLSLVLEPILASEDLLPRSDLWNTISALDDYWILHAAKNLVYAVTTYHGIFEEMDADTLERASRFLTQMALERQRPALHSLMLESPTGGALLWMGGDDEIKKRIADAVAVIGEPVPGPFGPSKFSEHLATIRGQARSLTEKYAIEQDTAPIPSDSARAHARKGL